MKSERKTYNMTSTNVHHIVKIEFEQHIQRDGETYVTTVISTDNDGHRHEISMFSTEKIDIEDVSK